MKLEVFKTPRAETPSPVYIALDQQDHGVLVRAVDEFGAPIPGGNLLAFTDEGTITRYFCVAESLGFKLDADGRIMFSGTCD